MRHYCYQQAKVKSAIETYDPSSQGPVSRRSHKFVFIQNGGFKSVENYTIKLAAKETKACFSILKLFILKYSFGHVQLTGLSRNWPKVISWFPQHKTSQTRIRLYHLYAEILLCINKRFYHFFYFSPPSVPNRFSENSVSGLKEFPSKSFVHHVHLCSSVRGNSVGKKQLSIVSFHELELLNKIYS